MRCPSVVPREAVRLLRERTGLGSGASRLVSSGSMDYEAVGEREREGKLERRRHQRKTRNDLTQTR